MGMHRNILLYDILFDIKHVSLLISNSESSSKYLFIDSEISIRHQIPYVISLLLELTGLQAKCVHTQY